MTEIPLQAAAWKYIPTSIAVVLVDSDFVVFSGYSGERNLIGVVPVSEIGGFLAQLFIDDQSRHALQLAREATRTVDPLQLDDFTL